MTTFDADSLKKIFKAYDVRGTVPDQLDDDVMERLGAAFAWFTIKAAEAAGEDAPQRILIAHDMRPTGVEFAQALARGVNSIGIDVVHLGLASTDLLFWAAGHMNAPGAMLTASHNPSHYNGVKLCLAGARPVGEETGLADIEAAMLGDLPLAPQPGTVTHQSMLDEFADHVRSFVDSSALRPMRIVADAANGMGGLIAPAVFEALPVELEMLYGELDGTFPNHPADPIQPENLRDLQARVLESGADVGLAFDGDADRVFLVDDKGNPVSGSLTTAIVAAAVLERNPGATILHNLICSRAVPEVIREHGGTPVRTRVGHSFIKKVMADTGAAFGGEHSGHYYFRDNFRADSGIIAAVTVLEVISRAGVPLSELRTPYERYADSGEINTEVDDPHAVIEAVAVHFGDAAQDRLDGLTCDFGDWWFNVRPSNTEPLLRLNLEAPTRAECDDHVKMVRDVIRSCAADSRREN